MTREIKFGAWDTVEKQFIDFVDDMPIRNLNVDSSRYKFMQYTGLKDKNGVESYQDDLVKFRYTSDRNSKEMVWIEGIARVVFEDGAFMFDCITGDLELSPKRAIFAVNQLGIAWEVIGNIYENPELLAKEGLLK